MLKPIWFLIKLAILVLGMTWLAARPGAVDIQWNGYLVETTFGFLLAVVASLMVACAVLYRLWRNLVNVPAAVRRYQKSQSREKGYEAVTKGLAAVAAGDPKGADRQARRARELVPDAPLTGLLNAQAALMNDDKPRARIEFESLLDDKNAAFFGLRGLMNEAMRDNDHEQALLALRTAENLHPRRGWIVSALFDAETRAGDWISADQTLTKAMRLKLFDRKTGDEHRQALLVARAYDGLERGLVSQARALAKKAYRIDPSYIPASTLYARLLVKNGNNRQAVRVIEEAWSKAPHPDLGVLWAKLAPKPRGKTEDEKNRSHLQWFKRLYATASYRPESNELMGRAAMDMKMYVEAREWLKAAGAYRLLAKLEQLDGRHNVQAREWLELAADARPPAQWVCADCGYLPVDWNPLCPNCRNFNTLDWRVPEVNVHRLTAQRTLPARDSGFIEPPDA